MTRIISAHPSFAPDLTSIVARGDEAEQRLRAKFAPAPIVFVEHDEAPVTDIPPLLLLFSVCAGSAIWGLLIWAIWP